MFWLCEGDRPCKSLLVLESVGKTTDPAITSIPWCDKHPLEASTKVNRSGPRRSILSAAILRRPYFNARLPLEEAYDGRGE